METLVGRVAGVELVDICMPLGTVVADEGRLVGKAASLNWGMDGN